jgi:Protein of unknown function (DUF4242)
MTSLAHFTLQLRRPAGGWADLERTTARAREAAVAMQAEGIGVRLLRSVFVPEDDTCFLLYEAPSGETVRQAAARAGLASDDVHASEAVG